MNEQDYRQLFALWQAALERGEEATAKALRHFLFQYEFTCPENLKGKLKEVSVTIIEPPKGVIYLAQKYTGKKNFAYYLAVYNTKLLRHRGFIVLSSILHSHPYNEYLQEELGRLKTGWENEDYDPEALAAYLKGEDYVAWDLMWLAAMPNAVLAFMDDCFATKCKSQCTTEGIEKNWADGEKCSLRCPYAWNSKGAMQEYGWAHDASHIRKCVRLKDLIEKGEVDQCPAI